MHPSPPSPSAPQSPPSPGPRCLTRAAPLPFWRCTQLASLNLSFSFFPLAFPWVFWADCLDWGFTVAFLEAHCAPHPPRFAGFSQPFLDLHSISLAVPLSPQRPGKPIHRLRSCLRPASRQPGSHLSLWVGSGLSLAFALFSLVWSPSGIWGCLCFTFFV